MTILNVETTRRVDVAAYLPRDEESLSNYPLVILGMIGVAQAVRVSVFPMLFSLFSFLRLIFFFDSFSCFCQTFYIASEVSDHARNVMRHGKDLCKEKEAVAEEGRRADLVPLYAAKQSGGGEEEV